MVDLQLWSSKPGASRSFKLSRALMFQILPSGCRSVALLKRCLESGEV